MSSPAADKKAKIPRALREQVWLASVGSKYEAKCTISWCNNRMSVFDFHVGHNKPESKGGTLALSNLKAICTRCNLSMGNQYTIDEWNKLSPKTVRCGCYG
jgi:5-methylcytosine-specific restriction endonuclease McrA